MLLSMHFTGMSVPFSLQPILGCYILCWEKILIFLANFLEVLSLGHRLLDQKRSHWDICHSMSTCCSCVVPYWILFRWLLFVRACWCVFVEPNDFEHALHRNVSAIRLAADFKLLHAVLKESPEFSNKFPCSIIIGPSTTGAKTKTLSYLSQYVCLLKLFCAVYTAAVPVDSYLYHLFRYFCLSWIIVALRRASGQNWSRQFHFYMNMS